MTLREFVRVVERELGRSLTADESSLVENIYQSSDYTNRLPSQTEIVSTVNAVRTMDEPLNLSSAQQSIVGAAGGRQGGRSFEGQRSSAPGGSQADLPESRQLLQQLYTAAANAGHEKAEVDKFVATAQLQIDYNRSHPEIVASATAQGISLPSTLQEAYQEQIDLYEKEAVAKRGAPIGMPAGTVAQREVPIPPSAQEASQAQTTDLLDGRPVGTPRVRLSTVEPRYYPNDENNFAGMAPERIVRLQKQMETAGLLEPGSYYPGFWVPDIDGAAMYVVMDAANNSGRTAEEQLAVMAANVPDTVKEARNAAKLAKQFQAPAYVKPDFASLAQDVKTYMRSKLGRAPSDEEMAALTASMSSAYRADYEAEVTRQRSEFDAQRQGLETGIAQTPAAVTDVDPVARFQQAFDQRFGPEMNFIQGQQETALNMRNVMDSITTMSRLVR